MSFFAHTTACQVPSGEAPQKHAPSVSYTNPLPKLARLQRHSERRKSLTLLRSRNSRVPFSLERAKLNWRRRIRGTGPAPWALRHFHVRHRELGSSAGSQASSEQNWTGQGCSWQTAVAGANQNSGPCQRTAVFFLKGQILQGTCSCVCGCEERKGVFPEFLPPVNFIPRIRPPRQQRQQHRVVQ